MASKVMMKMASTRAQIQLQWGWMASTMTMMRRRMTRTWSLEQTDKEDGNNEHTDNFHLVNYENTSPRVKWHWWWIARQTDGRALLLSVAIFPHWRHQPWPSLVQLLTKSWPYLTTSCLYLTMFQAILTTSQTCTCLVAWLLPAPLSWPSSPGSALTITHCLTSCHHQARLPSSIQPYLQNQPSASHVSVSNLPPTVACIWLLAPS